MSDPADASGYRWKSAELAHSATYLLRTVAQEAERFRSDPGCASEPARLFDLGCGNGSIADALARRGWDVTGVDPSKEGIAQARLHYPHSKLYEGSSDEDLVGRFGHFPVVISLEVIEHVYLPRRHAAALFSLVEAGGIAIVSTPYHGYWKNLALALSGRMDAHFTALWDHGHIKFWSVKTLDQLLREAGFIDIRFFRLGRIPSLAKSMVAVASKPRSDGT